MVRVCYCLGSHSIACAVGVAVHPPFLPSALMLFKLGCILCAVGFVLEFVPRLVKVRSSANPHKLDAETPPEPVE